MRKSFTAFCTSHSGWKRGVTDEAPLLKEYEGDKQTHQVNITEPPVAKPQTPRQLNPHWVWEKDCLCASLPAIVMKLEREVHVWFMAVSGLKAPLLHKGEALPKHTIYHSHLSSHHPSLFTPRLITSLPRKTHSLFFCSSQCGGEQEVFNLAVIYWPA